MHEIQTLSQCFFTESRSPWLVTQNKNSFVQVLAYDIKVGTHYQKMWPLGTAISSTNTRLNVFVLAYSLPPTNLIKQ